MPEISRTRRSPLLDVGLAFAAGILVVRAVHRPRSPQRPVAPPKSPDPPRATARESEKPPAPRRSRGSRLPIGLALTSVYALVFFACAGLTPVASDPEARSAPLPPAAAGRVPHAEAAARTLAISAARSDGVASTGTGIPAPAAHPAVIDAPRRRSAARHGVSPVEPQWVSDAAAALTPRAVRLRRRFASTLVRQARAAHADWALVLGLIQAAGQRLRIAASPGALRAFSRRVSTASKHAGSNWSAAAALARSTTDADRAVALARYARAVGLRTLVTGLDGSKQELARRVLADPRIVIYGGGRGDLAAGRVNARVTAVIAYLAETFGSVDVSSLVSGHRVYARPGVVSAHVRGDAVDVVALGGVPVLGHQQPGGVVEEAIQSLLALPRGLEPRQIISLLDLGGPSFSLASHFDHIHIGY